MLVRYPDDRNVRGVVLLNGLTEKLDSVSGDLLDYLASKGFIGIVAEFSQSEFPRLKETEAITDWAASQKEFNDYPIFLAGFGSGGRHSILAACNSASNRVHAVAAINAPLDWPFAELSPTAMLGKIRTPLLLIASSDSNTGASEALTFVKSARAQGKNVDAGSIRSLGTKLGQFDALDAACNFFEAIPNHKIFQGTSTEK